MSRFASNNRNVTGCINDKMWQEKVDGIMCWVCQIPNDGESMKYAEIVIKSYKGTRTFVKIIR